MPNLISSGDIITILSNGSNLVDGLQTWELSESHKDNLEIMLKCCAAELATMKTARLAAAPFYFERAAILLRKQKLYREEVMLCKTYIDLIGEHYRSIPRGSEADVRKGPRFKAIKERMSKAKILSKKAKS